jgi:hypothetical protein
VLHERIEHDVTVASTVAHDGDAIDRLDRPVDGVVIAVFERAAPSQSR